MSRYCKLDEDNDPSPEFEEYLSCAQCGDNGEFSVGRFDLRCGNSHVVGPAHRQCARDANTLSPDDGMSPCQARTAPY